MFKLFWTPRFKLFWTLILGVVLGFVLDYAVVHHEVTVLARRTSIQGIPGPHGIHTFALKLPDGCTRQEPESLASSVIFECLLTAEGPDASICETQLYERGKHPKLEYAVGKEPANEEPASGPYAKVLVISQTLADFDPYLTQVLDAVRQNWYGPIKAQKKTGVAEINLIILPDGNVDRVKLTSSSGDAAFDRTALRAITASVPFNPMPRDEYKGSYVALKFTLRNNP